MKKNYHTPRLKLTRISAKDIVTLSALTDGLEGNGYDFSAGGSGSQDIIRII